MNVHRLTVLLVAIFASGLFAATPAAVAPPSVSPNRKKLIFVNFYNTTGNKNTAYLESSIVDSIHELIKDKYAYDRVSADEWRRLETSGKYTAADFYDPEKLQKIGAFFRADGIIFGKLTAHPDGILITGKILSVVEKEVIAEKELVAPLNAEMFQKVNEISEVLAAKIKDLFIPSDLGALRRSAMLPGWGQFYKQRRPWGYIWGISVGTAFFTAAYFTYAYLKNSSAYQNAGPDDDAAGLYKKVEFNYSAMNVAWIITGTLYALNLIDALIFDGDYNLSKPVKASLLPKKISIGMNTHTAALQSAASRGEIIMNIAWRSAL